MTLEQKGAQRDFLYPRVSWSKAAIQSMPLTGGKAKWLMAMLIGAALGAMLLSACGSSESGADQFRDKTKSPLLDFGEEASGDEREAAADVVHAFYLDRARGDWQGTCAQLSQEVLDRIERLATTSTDLADKSCPSFLKEFTRISARERKESTVVDAGSLRQRGEQGYLIYYGGREVVYAMPLSKEGGTWKVGALSSKQLS